MSNRCTLVFLCCLALATIPRNSIAATTQQDNETLAVCPNALWKKLIFLKGPAPASTFDNVTHWKQAQVQDYAKKTVFPQVQANVVFFFVALACLIGFTLWRLFRCCCVACCMRESCQKKRAANNPKDFISGCGFWMLKLFLLVVAAAAVAIMVAGIVLAQKQVVNKLWPPLDGLTAHLTTMADDMDALMRSLDGVNPIVGNLSAIGTNDIDFVALRSSMQSISSFLDLPAADPAAMDSALGALTTGVASATSQLATWQPQLAALQPNAGYLSGNISSLTNAVSTLSTYSSQLNTLSTELAFLTAASGPLYNTTNLAAAMNAVDLSTWQPTVKSMLAALDAWRGLQGAVSISSLSATATALDAAITSLKNVQLPTASSSITAFFNAWNTYGPAFGSLIARIDSIQATVVVLDAPTTAALQPLRTLYSNLTALQVQGVPPAALASNLTALASELSLGPASALVAGLNSTLGAAPGSVLDGARTAVAAVQTALAALQPKKDATATALNTYTNSKNQANFNALKATVSGAGNTGPLTSAAQTAAAAAAADANVAAVQTAVSTGNLVAAASSVNTNQASASSAAATAADRLSARVPPLAPYTGLTSTARAAYAGLPSPKSSALASVQRSVNDVENQLINVPANVQYQVTNAQRSFQNGIAKLRSQVINKVNNFEADKKPMLRKADAARFQVTCVLFAVGGAGAALMLLFVAISCPCGIIGAAILMLIMSALLFAFSVFFATGLVVAQDGCHNAENISLTAVGNTSSVQPLLEYYFFAAANSSVRSVLRDANLVDVDKVENEITSQARGVIANITATYAPRPKLQAVLDSVQAFIDSTLSKIDGVLALAGVDSVRPLYEALKSYPCCDLATYGAKSYVMFTLGGWILMFTCNVAFGFLGKLDQLLQSGCCGCKPVLMSRIQKQVHPEGDEEGGDAGGAKVAKAVVLDPPGQQAMGSRASAGGGFADPAAGAPAPSAPPMPPYGVPPYAMGPGGAYAMYPPPGMGMGPGPYGGGAPMQPYGTVPPGAGQQHYVGAFVGAPMGPRNGVPVDPYTGMQMMAPPPAPVAPPVLQGVPPAPGAASQFPPIGPQSAR